MEHLIVLARGPVGGIWSLLGGTVVQKRLSAEKRRRNWTVKGAFAALSIRNPVIYTSAKKACQRSVRETVENRGNPG